MINSSKRSFSNNVLIDTKKNYYLPCYLRFVLKQVCDVNIQQAKGYMSATLILSIYYKGIPEIYFKNLQESVQLMFNNQQKVTLITSGQNSNTTITWKKKENIVNYFYRGKFPLKIFCPHLFLTPFQTIELKLSISIRSIVCHEEKDFIKLKFNLMDNQVFSNKFSTTMIEGQGEFGIASNLFSVEFQNQKQIYIKKKKQQKQWLDKNTEIDNADSGHQVYKLQVIDMQNQNKKIKNWQYANYTLAFYRYPGTTILTIFFPMWLLAFINLAIFFSGSDLSGRLQNLGGLMIAYTAFLPTIRQRIPPSSKITFTDILIYSLILTSLLCTIRSVTIAQMDNFKFKWNQDGLFIISVIIDIISFVVVMVLLFLYKVFWQPTYKSSKMNEQISQFNSLNWKNDQCDLYFQDKCKKIIP